MSYEREYLLQAKYNRALNKIAELEDRLRISQPGVASNTFAESPALERRDSEILQNELFLLQQNLETVTLERDIAVGKLLALSNTNERPIARSFPATGPHNQSRAVQLILEIEKCLAELRKELGTISAPTFEQ